MGEIIAGGVHKSATRRSVQRAFTDGMPLGIKNLAAASDQARKATMFGELCPESWKLVPPRMVRVPSSEILHPGERANQSLHRTRIRRGEYWEEHVGLKAISDEQVQ